MWALLAAACARHVHADAAGDLAKITQFTFPMLEVPPAYADAHGSASDLTSTEVPELAAAKLYLTVLRFAPCTMLMPHTHPRANEFELTIKGTVRSFFVSDQDGALRDAVSPFGTLQIYPQVRARVAMLGCARCACLPRPRSNRACLAGDAAFSAERGVRRGAAVCVARQRG